MGIALPSSGTEAPRAYVVRAGAAAKMLTADEVYVYVQDRLANYKALDGGIFFVDSIPRTANGKIQRGKLERMNGQREMLAMLLRGSI
jgi:acyl-coenzyme A synthetase/AMP-(fatty) acid ligase